MCWRQWGSARWPGRQSACRCRGTRRPPMLPPSAPPTRPRPHGCAQLWQRAPPDATFPAMSTPETTTPPPRPNRPVYLDNQATTRCDPRVLQVMLPYFTDEYANPHSVEHVMGQRAEQAAERAREEVAALVGADAKEIVFTSGATESNNIAIKGAAHFAAGMGKGRRRIVTVATEHKCVLEAVGDLEADGFEPLFLPVRPDGVLDPDVLRRALE